jgi:hypothetical protein
MNYHKTILALQAREGTLAALRLLAVALMTYYRKRAAAPTRTSDRSAYFKVNSNNVWYRVTVTGGEWFHIESGLDKVAWHINETDAVRLLKEEVETHPYRHWGKELLV